MDSKLLEHKVDSIARLGVSAGAYPGCEVLVARNGTVVFDKTYGYHTYAKLQPSNRGDLYDFASVTKVTGPLPALMRLHDQGKFELDVPFYTYWPKWKHSNKKEMIVRDVLAHQARLQSWIPYWRNTVRNGHFKWNTFSLDSSDHYHVYVAPRIFLNTNYRKKIYRAIKKSPLEPEKKYLYSGLSFYLYPQIIKNLTGYDYPEYVTDSVYRPLGAYTLMFNPYKKYALPVIVPTENDTFFRKEQLHGWVHDEGAAMMGGISGNAGLFGTANDLAKLVQMYLQMGEFGGRRFISDSTMHEFTSCQFPDNGNRRGLGFDKPLIENATLTDERVYPARSASPASFGHSGYTGTFFWADPENGLLYIFFSNRVYPTRYNNKIYELNIRTSIHQVLYDAIKK
jgi:beta-N-acetylhexosaminidase